MKGGIYHGRESLCPVVTTSKGAESDGTEWNEILEFDISIRDIPRGAKLCFIVFAAPERCVLCVCVCVYVLLVTVCCRGKSKRKKAVSSCVFWFSGQWLCAGCSPGLGQYDGL